MRIIHLLIATSNAMRHMKRQSLGFDPTTQAVSVSGKHVWQAPEPGDMRGPCPGLNAMANHVYIPRNGFVSIPEVVEGMSTTYGVGFDSGTAIAILAAVEAGDGFASSIGGPPPSDAVVEGLLGRPLGISAAHNRFEGDASITRDDLYLTGDAHTFQLRLFKDLLDFAGDRDEFNLDLLGDYSVARYNHSLHNNPYFFRGPISILIPPGTAGLAANLFSNKSAEHPNGYLSRSTIKSFYGVTGDDNNLQSKPGHERIPESWYKWSPTTPYTGSSFDADVVAFYTAHPETLVAGGNTGTPNSMTSVDVGNLTGGVYNAENVLQDNNFICFMFQVLAITTPDIITNGGVINDVLGQVNAKVQSAIGDALSGLSCPQLARYDDGQLGIFPGYTRFNDRTGAY